MSGINQRGPAGPTRPRGGPPFGPPRPRAYCPCPSYARRRRRRRRRRRTANKLETREKLGQSATEIEESLSRWFGIPIFDGQVQLRW